MMRIRKMGFPFLFLFLLALMICVNGAFSYAEYSEENFLCYTMDDEIYIFLPY